MDRLLGMVGLAVRAGKVRFGAYMTERSLKDASAKAVVVASDLGKDNRKRIETAAAVEKVPVIESKERSEIGHVVGKKDVPVLCICDENFAAAIVKISKMSGKEGLSNE